MITTGKVVALIQAMGGGADPAVIEAKVEEWLDAHPEATTTVQDGSITEQKLATSIAQKLGLISSLSDEIDSINNVLNISTPAKATKAVNGTVSFFQNFDIEAMDIIKMSLANAISNSVYLQVFQSDGTRYTSRECPAGTTEFSLQITESIENAEIKVFTGGNVDVTLEINPAVAEPTAIESLKILAFPSCTVRSIAHRGNQLDAPMCTAPAYVSAKNSGYRIMENDIDITDDGHFVMWHDGYLHVLGEMVDINGYSMYTDGTNYFWYDAESEKLYTHDGNQYNESAVDVSTLTRCNGNNYAVRTGYSYGGSACIALPYDILRRIDFGVYRGEQFEGTQILSFSEWVILCKKLGCEIYVDAKLTYTSEIVTSAATIVKLAGMGKKTSWLGMSTADWITLRSIIPDARVGVLVNPSQQNVVSYAEYNTGRGLFFDGNALELTKTMIDYALSADFEVECYYTGYLKNDKTTVVEKVNQLIENGVQGITMDKWTVEDCTI